MHLATIRKYSLYTAFILGCIFAIYVFFIHPNAATTASFEKYSMGKELQMLLRLFLVGVFGLFVLGITAGLFEVLRTRFFPVSCASCNWMGRVNSIGDTGTCPNCGHDRFNYRRILISNVITRSRFGRIETTSTYAKGEDLQYAEIKKLSEEAESLVTSILLDRIIKIAVVVAVAAVVVVWFMSVVRRGLQ